MRKLSIALGVLTILAASSCRRTPLGEKHAGDAGFPSVSDAGRGEPIQGEAQPADAADAAPDAADASADTARDAADAGRDGTADGVPGVCPAGVLPLDVCGCGCCGEAMGRACYYPARGESRESIPNPMPTPSQCAMAGCSFGVRYLCCVDPGPDPGHGNACATDTSIEDLSRFTVSRRDGAICTTLEISSGAPVLPIAPPPGYKSVQAWRAPCDGSAPPAYAIGGAGSVTPGSSGTLFPFPRFDVHVALFFDAGTGTADAVRVDADDVAVAPRCASDVCPPCSVCAFDTSYSFTSVGGLAPYRDAFTLSPAASYTHYRVPEALPGTAMSCSPAIPTCGGGAIDAADLTAALADPDVQQAFTLSLGAGTYPFYGEDQRGGDGPAWQLTRGGGGGGFLVGAPCPATSTRPCLPIPPGMTRLVTLLSAFDQQQMADPSCAFTKP